MAKKYIKFIAKSSYRKELEQFLVDLGNNNLEHYDIKKLIGYKNRYRVRIGDIRCVFERDLLGNHKIVDIHMRGQIYKNIYK